MASIGHTANGEPQRLGRDNYTVWLVLLRRAAKAQSLWDMIVGAEWPRTPPRKADFAKPKPPKVFVRITQMEEGDFDMELITKSMPRTMMYDIARDQYEKYQERVRKAKALILGRVETDVRKEIQQLWTAGKMMEALYSKFGRTKKQQISDLKQQLARCTLARSTNAAEWTDRIMWYQGALKEVGIVHSNDDIARLILRMLPRPYDSFKYEYEKRFYEKGVQNHDLTFLVHFLPREQEKMRMEGKNLRCNHCRMSNHSEEQCWFLHPELMPDPAKKKAALQKA